MDPIYEHDCERCVFQGVIEVDGERADVYTCVLEDGHESPVIVMRYGDEAEACEYHGADIFLTPEREDVQRPALFGEAAVLVITHAAAWATNAEEVE